MSWASGIVMTALGACILAEATLRGLGSSTSGQSTNESKDLTSFMIQCADYSMWPNVDGGVTCGDTCTALVLTAPYSGRCDKYCGSFGHVCMTAAEEVNENCQVKYTGSCSEAIRGTSDMLCRCMRASPAQLPGRPVPRCKEFSEWPHVDGGVTCDDCTALVLTFPFGGRCDKYCESFGQVCTAAAEEVNDNCLVKYAGKCHEPILGTSDMLCQCMNASPAPTPGPVVSGWWSPWYGEEKGSKQPAQVCPLGFITEFTMVGNTYDGVHSIGLVRCNDGTVLHRGVSSTWLDSKKTHSSISGFSKFSGVYGVSQYYYEGHRNCQPGSELCPVNFWKMCLDNQCATPIGNDAVHFASLFDRACANGLKIAGFKIRTSGTWNHMDGIKFYCRSQNFFDGSRPGRPAGRS